MKTATVKVFKFNELSKEVQAKVLDNMRTINVDYDWWDGELDNFKYETKKLGFDIEVGEIEFNLDRGGMFGISPNGISVDDKFMQKELKLKKKPFVDIKFNVRQVGITHCEFPRDEWFKSSSNGTGWYDVIIKNATKDDIGNINLKISTMISDLCNLCKNTLDDLRLQSDELQENKAVEDTIVDNEYEFTEDGERWTK